MREWVNKDVADMAEDLERQVKLIKDEEEWAEARRAHLCRAIGHLYLALAELNSVPWPRR